MSPHEDFIRASKLDTKQVEQVLDTYKKAVKTLSAGDASWHPPNDIRKMTGLEGRFLWTEDLLAPAIISFKFDPNKSVRPEPTRGQGRDYRGTGRFPPFRTIRSSASRRSRWRRKAATIPTRTSSKAC